MKTTPSRSSERVGVSEINDRASFVALSREWDALVEATRDELFHRHEFLRIWIDNFAPRARLRVLTARDGEGRLVGALPLLEERSSLFGVPVRQLVSTANSHSCRFDLIAADPEATARAFLRHLNADRGWDVLRVIDVPEGGNAWALRDAAREAGLPTGEWVSQDSPYLPLPETMEALLAGLQSKFKANCRRRRKRLEEKGAVTFEKVTGGEDLEARLEEGFSLEQGGWKGARGSAIAQDGATRGFYGELARAAKYGGYLALYLLRLDGRPIAFHFGLTHRGKYLLLKPGYDERIAECSPGQLLMERVLADCVENRLVELDFLGPEMVWKRDWTDKLRRHTWLFAFRDTTLGRALCAAKFRWAPAAKEAVRRWRR